MNGRDRTAHLLTTGPLTTSEATKRAMLRDWGSRAAEFKEMMATVRRKLLELIGDTQGELECIPLQGSGTFAFEAMLGTLVGHDDKALALLNGAYGKRAVKILDRIGRRAAVLETPESLPPRSNAMPKYRMSPQFIARPVPACSIRWMKSLPQSANPAGSCSLTA